MNYEQFDPKQMRQGELFEENGAPIVTTESAPKPKHDNQENLDEEDKKLFGLPKEDIDRIYEKDKDWGKN